MTEVQRETRVLELKALQETTNNPQRLSDGVFSGLVGSIRRKGWYFALPDVWEYSPGEYRIISGHHRIRAAIAAGIIEQECNVIVDPAYTEEQARLDVLESNQRHGSFDRSLLRDFIDEMKGAGIQIADIAEDSGFDMAELEELFNMPSLLDDLAETDLGIAGMVREEGNTKSITFSFPREDFEEYVEPVLRERGKAQMQEDILDLCREATYAKMR